MNRTDTFTKIVAVLLFLAFFAYAISHFNASLSSRVTTADAVRSTVTSSAVASGIIVRDETVLESDELYIDISGADGRRVAAGQTVALAMSSETGLARAERIRELELETARLSAVLGSISPSTDITSRDTNIRDLVLTLTGSVARRNLDNIDSVTLNLASLVFTNRETDVTHLELEALEAELESLKGSSSADTNAIGAPQSGLFSKTVDGYEHLTISDLENLTPSRLEAIIDSRQPPPDGSFGKIVSGFNWYFAAVMSSPHAEALTLGQQVELDFGRYYSSGISATVHSFGLSETDECVVVFVLNTAMAETLSMRAVSADVLFETYDGIRIPTHSIRLDAETSEAYVYVVTAMRLERKNITVLFYDEAYAIIKREAGENALREGNTVVVSGNDLSEGMVLR